MDLAQVARRFGLSFIRDDHSESDSNLAFLDPASTECKASGFRVPPYFATPLNDNADRVWGIND
jgi:hypothetical protein